MGGTIATIGSLLFLLFVWLCGKKAGKKDTDTKVTKLKGEVTVLQAENNALKVQGEVQKEVSHIAVEATQKQTQAQADYDNTMNQLNAARRTNNVDMFYAIGSQLAQKMLERGATEK